MKVLFQGDSVTDGERDRSNPHDMGEGYPKYASAMLQDSFPKTDFEFVNLGISGKRTSDLVDRLSSDFVEINPDITVLMIGINDVWHHYSHGIETTDAQFEENLRTVLSAIREKTHSRLLLVQPILLDVEDKRTFREELARKHSIVRRLADEYADAYLPMDDILRAETTEEPTYYAADGVHPTPDGACYIGEACLGSLVPIVESILDGKDED